MPQPESSPALQRLRATFTFTIRVADSAGQSASQEFTIRVLSGNPQGATATLPSSARAEGLNGAFYTTDVTATNVSSSSASFTFKFLGNNQDGTGGDERTYTLAAGRTQTFADILGSVFGRTSDYGAISVSSAHSDWRSWVRPPLRVSAGPLARVSQSQSRRS